MAQPSMDGVRVKICGVTRPVDVTSAVEAGAAYIGLNFFPKSPRYVAPDQAAELALLAPPGVAKVSLTVDETDATLERILTKVPIDIIQLHGHETPQHVRALRDRFGLPVMKVVGVSSQTDIDLLDTYEEVADLLLVDAKPPKGAVLPGGNGVAFDWGLIAGRKWSVPWMLAGGLTPQNVSEAIRLTGTRQVDVSSGVESAPGQKDPARMAQFVQNAQS